MCHYLMTNELIYDRMNTLQFVQYFVCLFFCLFVLLSICPIACLSICIVARMILFVGLFLCPDNPFVYLSFCLFVGMFFNLSRCSSFYVFLFVCKSIFPFSFCLFVQMIFFDFMYVLLIDTFLYDHVDEIDYAFILSYVPFPQDDPKARLVW